MSNHNPCVSIGLPVFNGDQYLAESLESLLSQTYSDFELIISDNASTDGTQDICRTYAARDCRIRYLRNKNNLGAAKNFNRVFELSSGKYFKWATHDDLCAPEFLEQCVGVLNQNNSMALCFSRTREIDENGNGLRNYDSKPNLSSLKPHKRFYECVCVSHPQVAVFGLIRKRILKKTRLIGNYSSSDRVLLGELTLLGRFHEIPEYLFFKRDHSQQHWRMYHTRHLRQAWYDPSKAEKITFPHWRLLFEHIISVKRAPLTFYERIICYLYLMWWTRLHWRYLAENLILREPTRKIHTSVV